MIKALKTVGRYIMLMGRTFARPERMRMFFRQYINEMGQLDRHCVADFVLYRRCYHHTNQAEYRKPVYAALDGRLCDA